MAQTYQMKHNPQGTIYSLLTVESDGRMTMTFHGTDREISHEVTENADGWLCYPGAMFPGLKSGRWNKMDDGRCKMADVQGTVPAVGSEQGTVPAVGSEQGTVPAVGSEAESERTTEGLSPMCAEPAVPVESALRGQAPCNPPSATHTGDSPRHTWDSPRVRRQRKARKPRVEHQPIPADAPTRSLSSIDHQTSAISNQTSSTMKAIGMVAAATVALLVIYETGLLIPLGLIGLATGGILK